MSTEVIFDKDTEPTEQVEHLGKMCEERIAKGESILIPQVDRAWLKNMAERTGINLDCFRKGEIQCGSKQVTLKNCDEGGKVGTLKAQTAFMIEALGNGDRNQAIKRIQVMLEATLNHPEEAKDFVKKYFTEHQDEDGLIHYDDSGDLNKCRLEAIVSAGHRTLLILSRDLLEQESIQDEANDFTLKFLRERVLRGIKDPSQIGADVKRFIPKKPGEKVRTLPEGKYAKLLGSLCGTIKYRRT